MLKSNKTSVNRISFFLCILLLIIISIVLKFKFSDKFVAIFFFLGLNLSIILFIKLENKFKLFLLIITLLKALYSIYLFNNNIIIFPDTFGYLNVFMYYSDNFIIDISRLSSYIGSLHIGYPILAHYISLLFSSEIALYMVNISLFNISIILLNRIIKQRFSTIVVETVLFFCIISINLFIFTTNILKDSLALFLLVFSIFLYDRFLEKKSKSYLILLIFIIIFSTLTRIYIGGSILAAIFFDVIVYKRMSIKFISIISISFVILLFSWNFLSLYYEMILRFTKEINLSSIFNILLFPISMFFSPLPWNVLSIETIYRYLSLDSIMLLISSPLLIKSVFKLFADKIFRKKMVIFVVPLLIHSVALATQYETGAVRQRAAVFPFIILLYLSGLDKNKVEKVI